MRLEKTNHSAEKGWYAGPWNSNLAISVGFANRGIGEPHVHSVINEIYLVARGTAVIRVDQQSIILKVGGMAILEPGEAHTFLSCSPDYFHFVIHTPGLAGDEAMEEKTAVSHTYLGL